MRHVNTGTDFADFDAVRISVASSKKMKDWSHGEVTRPETINYRTQKPERDGLFCEKIFGPVKDINIHDSKFKGIRSREAAVDRKGELVTRSIVRRERMGHISLAAPVVHIWFLKGAPSVISQLTNMTVKNLERVIYFASYLILKVDDEKRDQMIKDAVAAHEAATEAIKQRYQQLGKEAADEVALKQLATDQTKEIDQLNSDHDLKITQLESLQKFAMISETDYRNLPEELADLIEVKMGAEAIKALLESIDVTKLIEELQAEAENSKGQKQKKTLKRLRMIEKMHRAEIAPVDMIMDVVPVIPPELRPMVQLPGGRFATSDLNDLYRRVINRNNRLKKLNDLKAPEVIRRNEMRMLQEAVDSLIDNNASRSGRAASGGANRRKLKSLADMLRGKQGRFRQNLLGKRVDYSGRSVIVAGPDLGVDECGLPKMMALELFKPFVIGKLLEAEVAHNIRSATRMIEAGEPVVWDALDEVIKGKYVLLNRAPSLHRLSVQAFKPKLIEGKAIRLHLLANSGFNADFDGDQMAVHLPLSKKAQQEASELMAASKNLLHPADSSIILHLDQDIVIGIYTLTKMEEPADESKLKAFASLPEAIMAKDAGRISLNTPIKLRIDGQIIVTSLGRALFNEHLPQEIPYVNETLTKKKAKALLSDVYAVAGTDQTAIIANDLKNLSLEYATRSGLSMGMSDFPEVDGVNEIIADAEDKSAEIAEQYDNGLITDDERYRLTVNNWLKANEQIQDKVTNQYVELDTSISFMVTSGARGTNAQVKNVVGSIGVLSDTTDRAIELPVKGNLLHGLSTLEYFVLARGNRKAMVDIALRTADSGYLTRKLVDVSQDVFTVEDNNQNDPGFPITREDTAKIGVTLASRLQGRYAAESVGKHAKKGQLIDAEMAKQIDDDESIEAVRIMSVLSTSAINGVPVKSYGIDPATNRVVELHHPAGVIAAQSIGEPGTQLSLDSKHRAGAAAMADDTSVGLNRVTEIFEGRSPKGMAYLSQIDGTVKVWEENRHYVVNITGSKAEQVEFPLNGLKPKIKSGTSVSKGDVIAAKAKDADPIICNVNGVAEVTKDKIIVTVEGAEFKRYEIPGFKHLLVSDGDKVTKGQPLTSGSINLQDLMELRGVEATQRYILTEISTVFASQGKNVADKHFEIIIRQMFSRVMVEDGGDSDYVSGDIVSKQLVVSENARLESEGKNLISYKQLLLGITKVSTNSDSFLSAASFQDTTRVLIGAAISGKVDELRGLKENVILGRKIPVGTGAASYTDSDQDDSSIDNQEQ